MTKSYRLIIAPLLALSTFTALPAPGSTPHLVAPAATGAAPSGDAAVVARIASLPITVGDVRANLRASGADALQIALQNEVDTRLLALQAKVVLGPASLALSVQARAAGVRAAMFSPNTLCRNIPMQMRRQLFDETRWRFQAPPAWTVTDLQWLCCQSPQDCKSAQASQCLSDQRAALPRFQKAVDDALVAAPTAPLAMVKERLAPTFPELFVKSYTFYFDPQAPDKKVGWRLQEVDRSIASVVGAMGVGATSKASKSRFGHHVVRLLRQRPGIDARFDDPRTQAILATELCPQLLVQQERRSLADLERQTPMKVFPEVLKAAFGDVWANPDAPAAKP